MIHITELQAIWIVVGAFAVWANSCFACQWYGVRLARSPNRNVAGAEEYAESALVALAGSGILTPEKGYISDGGPVLMAEDIFDLRDERDDWRRAATDIAEYVNPAANVNGVLRFIRARRMIVSGVAKWQFPYFYNLSVLPDGDEGQPAYYVIRTHHLIDEKLLMVAALVLNGGVETAVIEREYKTARKHCEVVEE